MEILLIMTVMLLLLLAGYPMKVPLLSAALAALLVFHSQVSPAVLVQQMIGGIRPAALLTVPMFIFAADIMTRGHSANRLLDLVMAFVGHLRGGLPIASAVSCTLFGAISGSTQAT
ncbi:MAG: TRAP transporter large permease subunit, partial [Planctomycetaceae bacterium]